MLQAWARLLPRRLRFGAAARLVWRVRGDGRAPESVAIHVLPRRGYRLARGLRSIDCLVRWQAGTLRWHPRVALELCAAEDSPAETALCDLAARTGALECVRQPGEVRFAGDLLGPDASALLRNLAAMIPDLISARATFAERASGGTAAAACEAASTPLVRQQA